MELNKMNNNKMKPYIFAALFTVFGLTATASLAADSLASDKDQAMAARITAQQNAPGRDQYDSIKDASRKPVEVAQFSGVRAGMTVLDITTGAGYSTEILSAAVGPEGLVYAQNPHLILKLIGGRHHDAMVERLRGKRLPNVRYLIVDAEDMPFQGSIDLVNWAFNIHDVYNEGGDAAALKDLQAMKLALKPGGILAVSDHVGVAGNDNEALHRIETATIINLLRQAGFVVEETSDLLTNPADDHSQSIFDDELRYHTDRVLIRARKLD